MAIGCVVEQERWPCAHSPDGFRRVLMAALNTRYYGTLMCYCGLGTPQAVARLGSIEEALARLPKVELGLVPLHSPTLTNPAAPPDAPGELYWPLPRPSRAALLSDLFPEDSATRRFAEGRREALLRWSPQALAAPVETLDRLLRFDLEHPETRLPLSHSVLALSGLRRAFADERLRDLVWRVWQVPVFGQLLGPSGELLAWECEAHEGYHYNPSRVVIEADGGGQGEPELLVTSLVSLRRPVLRVATRLTGRLESAVCACGSALPRLASVAPLGRSAARLARATCAAG